VVGAGFFGVRLALLLARRGASVALVEREAGICARASWSNQARVHNGYHYPRSLSTANGAHRHYERFLREMAGCATEGSATHLYAIARDGSATSAAQFERFCRHLGLPLRPARGVRTGCSSGAGSRRSSRCAKASSTLGPCAGGWRRTSTPRARPSR
jgi:glycine/D-amino acid oxidase-like deaminating enzyme